MDIQHWKMASHFVIGFQGRQESLEKINGYFRGVYSLFQILQYLITRILYNIQMEVTKSQPILTPHNLYDCLTQLKQALQIQENICTKNKNEENSSNSTLYMIIYQINSWHACNYDHV